MSPTSERHTERMERLQERRALLQIERTRLGVACGCVAIATAPLTILLTRHSIAAIQKSYGVSTRPGGLGGDLSPLLLTYLIGAGLVVGGIGLLLPKSWGWWVAIVSAALGPFDLLRIYRSLFAAVNLDHPDVDVVIRNLTIFTGIPALFYVVVLALLLQRRVKDAYRIGS